MIPLPKNVVDETGHVYGRLTVLEYAGREGESDVSRNGIQIRGAPALWLCRCECDREVTVRGAKLRSGRVVSCGCFRSDPAVRQGARMEVPAHRRKQIAQMGGQAWPDKHKPR